MHVRLLQGCEVDMLSVETQDTLSPNSYDAVIIGTPTYHASPAKAMMNYLDAMPQMQKIIPAFIFNTRGLCSLNTNRILAKKLQEKNIITIMDRAYRSPASDGSLVTPFIKRFFEFEKDIERKIGRDCDDFLKSLNSGKLKSYVPRFQFGSIINAPNKAAGHLITVKIYLHKDKCIKCGLCIEQCPHKAFRADKNRYPILNSKHCENCYRCVHHCSKSALSLSKRRTPQKLLKY